MTVRDAMGCTHPRASPGARIVSLVPSITELLFDLGLGEQVVGRTSFCIHPEPGVKRVARVGGTKTPRLDRILDLAPSHVVVNIDENRREDARRLQTEGIRVVATHPQSPRDNLTLYRLMGELFSCQSRCATLCEEFRAALAALEARAAARPRSRVLYLIWRKPWMAVSPDTYIARTIAQAGMDVVDIPVPGRYPEITADSVDWDSLDAVLLSSEPYPFKPEHAAELASLSGRGDLPVAWIDGEMTSWYGSRAIAGCRYLCDFQLPERLHRAGAPVYSPS